MKDIGTRVGAILGSNKQTKVIDFLGYGVYEGDYVPQEAVGMMADMLKEHKVNNPCIKLDSGQKVYGCECWWGSEEQVKEQLEDAVKQGYTVKDVQINEIREDFLRESKK